MNQHTQSPPEEEEFRPNRSLSWVGKFGHACRGIKIGMRAEASFFVHLFVTAIVIVTGWLLGISQLRWCLLALSITGVFTAELCNTAIERIARTITRERNADIRDALDIAAGAVFAASVGAVIVGYVILAQPLLKMMFQ